LRGRAIERHAQIDDASLEPVDSTSTRGELRRAALHLRTETTGFGAQQIRPHAHRLAGVAIDADPPHRDARRPGGALTVNEVDPFDVKRELAAPALLARRLFVP